MNELVIRGGTVVDGSGSVGVRSDVGISNGRITEIGLGLEGDRLLDAEGCVVAPGFIDIHTHYDAQVFWDPALTPSCYHGVTTVVAGNCGFFVAPTRRVRDLPAGGERLTAGAPVGMRHVLVNGIAVQVDGERTRTGNAGQLIKPGTRR